MLAPREIEIDPQQMMCIQREHDEMKKMKEIPLPDDDD